MIEPPAATKTQGAAGAIARNAGYLIGARLLARGVRVLYAQHHRGGPRGPRLQGTVGDPRPLRPLAPVEIPWN